MSKPKSKKTTFWSKYKTHIIVLVSASVIVYILIYLLFRGNGIFPVGANLEKVIGFHSWAHTCLLLEL